MNDDLRFLSHLAGWAALVAALSAALPPVDAYGIDDLGDDMVRSAPVVRLKDRVSLPVTPAKPEPVKAVAASGGGRAVRAAKAPRAAPSPDRFRTRLLGTRGQSRSALVERIWDGADEPAGADVLQGAAATGEPTHGTRRGGTGDDGPVDNVRLGQLGAPNVELRGVPVTVELGHLSSTTNEVGTMSLKGYVGGLRYCYEKRLMVLPGLGGRVELSLGRDRSPRIVVDTTGDEELGRCVLNAARRWELPEGVEEVQVPVVFTSSE